MVSIKPLLELEKLWKILPQRRKEQREKDVLFCRFAIQKDKQSLQTIGKRYGITRERVRQIQNQGIFGLRRAAKQTEKLYKNMAQKVKMIGGVMSLETAFKIFLPKASEEKDKNSLHLLLVANPFLNYFKETSANRSFFSYKIKRARVKREIQKVIDYFEKMKKAQNLSEAAKKINLEEKRLIEMGKISKNLGLRDKKIGLYKFPSINPKTTEAKIDLILEKYQKPLHFTELAKLIVKENISKKQPTVPTVHNELIKHNQKYVLIGRGTYALKKWGYMTGTVKDVIEQIIKESKKKLTRNELIEKIMEQRIVKRNTILLNLAGFKKYLSK